jgi:hypothetical protein
VIIVGASANHFISKEKDDETIMYLKLPRLLQILFFCKDNKILLNDEILFKHGASQNAISPDIQLKISNIENMIHTQHHISAEKSLTTLPLLP